MKQFGEPPNPWTVISFRAAFLIFRAEGNGYPWNKKISKIRPDSLFGTGRSPHVNIFLFMFFLQKTLHTHTEFQLMFYALFINTFVINGGYLKTELTWNYN